MTYDDRELGERFRARAATFPEPSAELFTVTVMRLDAAIAPRAGGLIGAVHNAANALRRLRLAALLMSRGGLTATLVAAVMLMFVYGANQMTRRPDAPERVNTVKIDRVPPPPGVPMPKMNALKVAPQSASASGDAPEPAAPAGQADAKASLDAAIARTESLGLLVRSVSESIAAIDGIAKAHGGMVIKIDDNAPDDADSPRTATLSLTVAAPQLDTATMRILALGAIQSRSATAEAIGDSIVDDRARLRNLRREETDLLHIMDRSGSVSSILDVESKLADVRGQIEQLSAHLATSNHRVATSQIDITLTESKPATAPATPTFAEHVNATWNAALRSIGAFAVSIVDSAIWLAAYLPALVVLALIAAFVIYRRRSSSSR